MIIKDYVLGWLFIPGWTMAFVIDDVTKERTQYHHSKSLEPQSIFLDIGCGLHKTMQLYTRLQDVTGPQGLMTGPSQKHSLPHAAPPIHSASLRSLPTAHSTPESESTVECTRPAGSGNCYSGSLLVCSSCCWLRISRSMGSGCRL